MRFILPSRGGLAATRNHVFVGGAIYARASGRLHAVRQELQRCDSPRGTQRFVVCAELDESRRSSTTTTIDDELTRRVVSAGSWYPNHLAVATPDELGLIEGEFEPRLLQLESTAVSVVADAPACDGAMLGYGFTQDGRLQCILGQHSMRLGTAGVSRTVALRHELEGAIWDGRGHILVVGEVSEWLSEQGSAIGSAPDPTARLLDVDEHGNVLVATDGGVALWRFDEGETAVEVLELGLEPGLRVHAGVFAGPDVLLAAGGSVVWLARGASGRPELEPPDAPSGFRNCEPTTFDSVPTWPQACSPDPRTLHDVAMFAGSGVQVTVSRIDAAAFEGVAADLGTWAEQVARFAALPVTPTELRAWSPEDGSFRLRFAHAPPGRERVEVVECRTAGPRGSTPFIECWTVSPRVASTVAPAARIQDRALGPVPDAAISIVLDASED